MTLLDQFDWCASGDRLVHLTPHQDIIDHEYTEFCVCGPDRSVTVDDRVIVVHHALDGRTVE